MCMRDSCAGTPACHSFGMQLCWWAAGHVGGSHLCLRYGLPIWALSLAIVIPVAYMVPFGFIFAMSVLPAGVNLVSELLASWLLPGRPLPVMMFKTIAQQTTTFGLLFSQDQKLGHYMKIPPREVFFIQITSVVVNSIMQILAKDFLRDHIDGLCDPNQPQRFSCPTVNIFYTASIIWGAIALNEVSDPTHPTFRSFTVFSSAPSSLSSLGIFHVN